MLSPAMQEKVERFSIFKSMASSVREFYVYVDPTRLPKYKSHPIRSYLLLKRMKTLKKIKLSFFGVQTRNVYLDFLNHISILNPTKVLISETSGLYASNSIQGIIKKMTNLKCLELQGSF